MAREQGRLPADDERTGAALQALRSALDREKPREFTPAAAERLFERQDEFLEELGVAAIHQARRARSDVVSAADVERADQVLRVGSRSRREALTEVLGGVLAGAGLGEFIDVLSEDDPSTLAIALPSVLMVVGAVILTVALLRR